jgi:hypothetical protein
MQEDAEGIHESGHMMEEETPAALLKGEGRRETPTNMCGRTIYGERRISEKFLCNFSRV